MFSHDQYLFNSYEESKYSSNYDYWNLSDLAEGDFEEKWEAMTDDEKIAYNKDLYKELSADMDREERE